ncbi:MAG: thioredoxin family protein [Spirochaetes bacterium]|nr:thioredoxin family protein [Spirochaetota bacterium]
MLFEIIGPGCGFCERLYDLTTAAVADNCPEAEVRKVTDWKQVIRHVPFTPVLKLDGRVIHRGKNLPSKDKLAGMIAARIHP